MPSCRHHWILGQPQDALIQGRCKKCDLARVFPARLDDTDRGNDYLELTASGASSGWGMRAA